ncbi:pseudouridine synthase [Paenibacillus chitinolyticus]|uniref:pseudouridine synthase n=1 Tax=Paenibacillus chitinolyticus TaxID=79263 RepID=UPI002DBC67BE|nr:pseudouridine synthase [Paenibacillus chitinolyticus]MEC0247683.1 pseudouridine synthase [Paenibacillus chitinolyticus]
MKRKTQRLDKVLGNLGYGSRSDLKKTVKNGFIEVNGIRVKDSGMQVDPEQDEITVSGGKIVYREFVYLLLNKPQGVVSATEDNRDRTVVDLLGEAYAPFDVFPVGRLDKDTEGLLLLTNDGKLAHNLLSPRKHVPKTYYAKVEGLAGEADKQAFEAGVELDDGYVTMPAQLRVLTCDTTADPPRSEIELTIQEGKFHQVKRMFQAVGKRVIYLKRISMGPLQLDPNLGLGEYRELTREELELLQGNP